MEKKKVLIVNQHFLTGGIKKALDNLLPELMKKYEVKVLFLCGPTKEFEEKYPNKLIRSPFLLSSALSSSRELKEMKLFILRLWIKVIYLFMAKIMGMERTTNLFVKMSKRLGDFDCAICFFHDNWFSDKTFFGGGNKYVLERVNAKKKISWIHGEPHAIGLTSSRLLKTYEKFDEVITVSHACKKEFEELSDGKIKCHAIYNLFDINDIKEKTKDVVYHEENGRFKLVTVGRLSKVAKRIDKVNEIAKLLKDDGYKFIWTVVGGGSEYDSCMKKREEYGLENMVRYVGNQSNPYTYMKDSDLFVLVSDTESMSMVINESLIVGTPVVTTDFPAAYESISDGENGFIVNRDVRSIYEKIVYCINHVEEVRRLRKNIQQHPLNNEQSLSAIETIIG